MSVSTWGVHAVEGWHKAVVLQSHVIALLQQTSDVGTVLSLREQPTIELGSQHLRVELQNGSSQSERGKDKSTLVQRALYLIESATRLISFLAVGSFM